MSAVPAVGPPLVLVAHGTRDRAGTAMAGRLATGVRRRLAGVEVRVAFVDVCGPTVAEVLSAVLGAGSGAVVVPAFLAAGYHVRHDLPAQLATAGLADEAWLTPALGPDPLLVAAAEDRLRHAGWRPGDAVLLAAAGSSDSLANADVAATARMLGARLGGEVRVGYLASGAPRLSDLVSELRSDGRRVAVASWLLAPGLFQERLAASGAHIAADPLGAHPAVVDAVIARYRHAGPARYVHTGPVGPRPVAAARS